MKWVCLLLGLLVGGWSTVGRTAEPEPELRLEVLPVALDGELPPDIASDVRSLIIEGLGDDGGAAITHGDVSCEDDECRRSQAQASSAHYVVGAEVSGDEDEYTVSLTLFSGTTGEALQPFVQSCSICGLIEVRDMARRGVLDVRAEIARRRALAESPPPASSLRTEGASDRPRLARAGWVLAGAGGATTLGGIAVLALHRRSAGCQADPRGGDCVPLRYTTVRPGVAVLGVGVVTLAGAVTMIVLGRRGSGRTRHRRVSARPGGVMLKF